MNKKRRKLSLIFCITLMISLLNSNNVLAAEVDNKDIVTNTVTVNEMEYINSILNSTDEELLSKGYSEEEISEIRQHNYNDDLLSLGELSTTELKQRGFSDNQIKDIKEYDGTVDAVEYATINGLSNAELNGRFYVVQKVAKQSVEIWYRFTWTSVPIFAAIDNVVVAWSACDANSYPILTSVMYESHEVTYHNPNTEEQLYYIPSYVNKQIGYRVVDVKMHNGGPYDINYGKVAWGYVAVKTASGSYNLNNIIVGVGYGHTVIGLSASPSVDISGVSIGINFDWNQQDLFNEVRNFKYDGTISW